MESASLALTFVSRAAARSFVILCTFYLNQLAARWVASRSTLESAPYSPLPRLFRLSQRPNSDFRTISRRIQTRYRALTSCWDTPRVTNRRYPQ